MEEIGAEDENRLWEEAEAKRRAEFAKKIREEAETSAKIRAEEDRLWEEAWAKKKAEVERRMREEAEAKNRNEEKNRFSKAREAETKRRAEQEKRIREKTEIEAKRKAEKERRIREEEALAKRKAEEEKRIKETPVAANRDAEKEVKVAKAATAGNNPVEYRQEFVAEVNKKTKEASSEKNTNIKKRVLVGFLVAIFVALGIWAFFVFNTDFEKQASNSQKNNATVIEDSKEGANISEKAKIEPQIKEETFPKLAVGDTYQGGIVFAVDGASKTGTIAHIDDFGPMTWTDAMKIHEELGEGWRLPTFHELQIMYRTIGQGATNDGEFTDELYWSATPYDEYQARLLRFRDGNTSYHYNKVAEHRKFLVRAIRDFSR